MSTLRFRLLLILFVVASHNHFVPGVSAQTSSAASAENASPASFQPVWDAEQISVPAVRGVWRAKGYGFVIQISEKGMRAFDEYSGGGWEDQLDEVPELFFRFLTDDKDKCQITFHPLDGPYNVVRLDSIPAACTEKTEWTQTKLFEAFAATMNDYYPFFEARKVDWDARVAAGRKKVSDDISDQQLFDVFKTMLDGLDDAHTRLLAEIDDKRQIIRLGEPDTLDRLHEKHKSLDGELSFGDFMDQRIETYFAGVASSLGQKPTEAANQLLWGKNEDGSIGYLMVKGMGGFAESESINDQLDVLHKNLNEILTELADTEAIVIDISLNGGGMDLYSIAIASHFADKKRLAFSKGPAGYKEHFRDVYVEPYAPSNEDGVTYTKPVYLITGDVSVSAAEIFVMCMRAFPHVKTAGLTTRGALSDVLEKTLPNGWELALSNEVYNDHEGICHEGIGIQPNIELDLFEITDDSFSHSAALNKLFKLIKEK